MEDNKWIQIKVTSKCENLDSVCAVMSMISNGLQIEDYSDLESRILDGVYGDLIDESVLNADREHASVSVYVPADKPTEHYTVFLKEKLDALKIEYSLELFSLNEEDWADSWKQYYKPIKIGQRLVVVPMWEKYDAAENEVIVKMDPGMAFGTGTHETTRLCATLLESYVNNETTMLDVGCGSGILAICASKLGAKKCYAYDIDPVAVKVARENVKDNGCTNITCGESDLLAGVESDGFDLVLANIVADIILRMVEDLHKYIKSGTLVVTSGIIIQKSDEVKEAFLASGYELADMLPENDWVSFVFRKI